MALGVCGLDISVLRQFHGKCDHVCKAAWHILWYLIPTYFSFLQDIVAYMVFVYQIDVTSPLCAELNPRFPPSRYSRASPRRYHGKIRDEAQPQRCIPPITPNSPWGPWKHQPWVISKGLPLFWFFLRNHKTSATSSREISRVVCRIAAIGIISFHWFFDLRIVTSLSGLTTQKHTSQCFHYSIFVISHDYSQSATISQSAAN